MQKDKDLELILTLKRRISAIVIKFGDEYLQDTDGTQDGIIITSAVISFIVQYVGTCCADNDTRMNMIKSLGKGLVVGMEEYIQLKKNDQTPPPKDEIATLFKRLQTLINKHEENKQ